MVSLSKFHKVTVPIEGHAVQVRIARLTYNQAEEYRRGLEMLHQKTRRQNREMEHAAEMAPNVLAELQAVHEREDQETDAFVRRQIEAYVTVEPNQITVDGREIASGQDLLDYFGSDTGLVMRLIQAIDAGSKLSATTGKTSGSPSDSTRSSGASDASDPEADGPRPGEIAASAALEGSIGSAAVRAATAAPSSGLTATSR